MYRENDKTYPLTRPYEKTYVNSLNVFKLVVKFGRTCFLRH